MTNTHTKTQKKEMQQKSHRWFSLIFYSSHLMEWCRSQARTIWARINKNQSNSDYKKCLSHRQIPKMFTVFLWTIHSSFILCLSFARSLTHSHFPFQLAHELLVYQHNTTLNIFLVQYSFPLSLPPLLLHLMLSVCFNLYLLFFFPRIFCCWIPRDIARAVEVYNLMFALFRLYRCGLCLCRFCE